MQPAAEITFGVAGNAAPYQVSGWSYAEDGFTWALGPEAVLRVPLRPGAGDLLLDLTLRPFMVPPYRDSQRIAVSVGGKVVGEARVQDDSAVGYRIPAELITGASEVELTLHLPDALRPVAANAGGDERVLGVRMREALLIWAAPEPAIVPRRLPPLPPHPDMVRGLTALTPDALMLQFESLGSNCEFGLVQRRLGAEPLGLLRFVGIKVQNLLTGLDFGFEGVDDPAQLRAYSNGGEDPKWISVSDRYDIHRDSNKPVADLDEAAFLVEVSRKLAFERRLFLEVLAGGEKLFVYQRLEAMAPPHVQPILNMLRSHGRNALLFVTLNHAAPAGSVDLLGPDLYRGNIDRLAPIGNAVDSNLPAWLSICANAYRLWRETGHGT